MARRPASVSYRPFSVWGLFVISGPESLIVEADPECWFFLQRSSEIPQIVFMHAVSRENATTGT